ncbi:transposase [Streptosporangium brasiliense]|uniref:Transposase n=1 Tax=Streptosporangium brasiliense TaxID=47480 RepID=A0ABT9QVP1_9ACTN|nr:transposase [Streptosporangium brasiliense]
MTRGDLTDEEWSLIEPHLPLAERGPIPDPRRLFNAVMWRFRTGRTWRDLPTEYGPWSTAYDRFRSWALNARDGDSEAATTETTETTGTGRGTGTDEGGYDAGTGSG